MVFSEWFPIAIQILLVIILFIIAIMIIIKYRAKEEFEELPFGYDFCINFKKQVSEGHALFGIKQRKRGAKKGIMYGKPIDKITKKNGTYEEVKLIPIPFDNDISLNFGKGTLSDHRNFLWIFPKDPKMLPKEIRDTEIGKGFEVGILMEKIKDDVYVVQREANNKLKQTIIENGLKEINDRVKTFEEEIKKNLPKKS